MAVSVSALNYNPRHYDYVEQEGRLIVIGYSIRLYRLEPAR